MLDSEFDHLLEIINSQDVKQRVKFTLEFTRLSEVIDQKFSPRLLIAYRFEIGHKLERSNKCLAHGVVCPEDFHIPDRVGIEVGQFDKAHLV
jgi:hypothetical protein